VSFRYFFGRKSSLYAGLFSNKAAWGKNYL